jgi:hypothetical protein
MRKNLGVYSNTFNKFFTTTELNNKNLQSSKDHLIGKLDYSQNTFDYYGVIQDDLYQTIMMITA